MDGSGALTETIEGLTLKELAGLGLELARDLQQRALAAEENGEAARLAEAFARVGRGVRQTIALKMKLIRDEQAFFRDFRPQLDQQRKEAVAKRRLQLHNEVAGLIWTEFEQSDFAQEMIGDLHDKLEEESRLSTFLDEPISYQLARLKAFFEVDGRGCGGDAEDDDHSDQEDGEGEVAEEPAAAAAKPIRWGGPPDDPFALGEITVIGMGSRQPDDSS